MAKVRAAMRNARGHVSALVKEELQTQFPFERAADGTSKVCCICYSAG